MASRTSVSTQAHEAGLAQRWKSQRKFVRSGSSAGTSGSSSKVTHISSPVFIRQSSLHLRKVELPANIRLRKRQGLGLDKASRCACRVYGSRGVLRLLVISAFGPRCGVGAGSSNYNVTYSKTLTTFCTPSVVRAISAASSPSLRVTSPRRYTTLFSVTTLT
jgi:hypothetical protein